MPTMPTVRLRKVALVSGYWPCVHLPARTIAIGLREFAHRAQQQAERGVGHLFVEHFRRVGDDDAVLAGPFGVDMVVADAETRNLLELGEAPHEGAVDLVGGIGDDDGAHLVGDGFEERVLVRRVDQLVQRDLAVRAP